MQRLVVLIKKVEFKKKIYTEREVSFCIGKLNSRLSSRDWINLNADARKRNLTVPTCLFMLEKTSFFFLQLHILRLYWFIAYRFSSKPNRKKARVVLIVNHWGSLPVTTYFLESLNALVFVLFEKGTFFPKYYRIIEKPLAGNTLS